MKVSTLESSRGFQPRLDLELEPVVLPFAACRAHIGDLFELATAQLVCGQRLRTDSTCDVCPDVFSEAFGAYVESKSVGLNNHMALYQCRFEKDRAFIREKGCRLVYAFWRHKFPVSTEGCDLEHLRREAAQSCYEVLMVDFSTLEEIVAGLRLAMLNRPRPDAPVRMGYGSRGYNEGWRVPMSKIAPYCETRRIISGLKPYGREIPTLRVASDERVRPLIRRLKVG